MRRFCFLFDIPDCSFSIHKPYSKERGEFEVLIPSSGGFTSKIIIRDQKELIDGAIFHRGLKAKIDISGDNIESASEQVKDQLQAILSMATFQSNATVKDIYLELGYEITPDSETTEFLQVEYWKGDLLKKKRSLDIQILSVLIKKISQNQEKRISRAGRWYRKGLMEEDPFDRFSSFWVGLENLNKPLMTLLGEEPETRNCSSCSTPYEVPIAKGIRAIFKKYSNNGLEDFKLCRNLRVDLQHGTGDLSLALKQVGESAELCRKMLRIGIYLLLGLTKVEDFSEDQAPIYNIYYPRVEYRGHFKISPSELKQPPLLTITSRDIEVGGTDDERTVSLTDAIDSNVPAAVTFKTTLITEVGVRVELEDVRSVP